MAGASEIYRGNKTVVTTIASGNYTASAVQIIGYAVFGLTLPVITSGAITLMAGPSAEATPVALYDRAGALYSAATPGGTGGCQLDSNFLNAAAGYELLTISGAQQTALRTLVWNLKG